MGLHVERSGQGHLDTVLLHGFLGSSKNLGVLVRGWNDPHRRFWAIDLPGHGRSVPTEGELSLDRMAQEVWQTLDLSQVGSVRVLGHSLGGRVALVMRRQAKERVRGIDLLDITPGPIRSSDADRILDALLAAPDHASSRQEMMKPLLDRGLPVPLVDWLSMNLQRTSAGVRWRIDRNQLQRFHQQFAPADLWDAVDLDPKGTRALVGAHSPYVPPADQEALHARGVAVDHVPEAGHFLHAEAPDAVLTWLRGSPL